MKKNTQHKKHTQPLPYPHTEEPPPPSEETNHANHLSNSPRPPSPPLPPNTYCSSIKVLKDGTSLQTPPRGGNALHLTSPQKNNSHRLVVEIFLNNPNKLYPLKDRTKGFQSKDRKSVGPQVSYVLEAVIPLENFTRTKNPPKTNKEGICVGPKGSYGLEGGHPLEKFSRTTSPLNRIKPTAIQEKYRTASLPNIHQTSITQDKDSRGQKSPISLENKYH